MRIERGPNVLYFLHSSVRESWPRVVYFEPTFKSMKSFLKLYKQIVNGVKRRVPDSLSACLQTYYYKGRASPANPWFYGQWIEVAELIFVRGFFSLIKIGI